MRNRQYRHDDRADIRSNCEGLETKWEASEEHSLIHSVMEGSSLFSLRPFMLQLIALVALHPQLEFLCTRELLIPFFVLLLTVSLARGSLSEPDPSRWHRLLRFLGLDCDLLHHHRLGQSESLLWKNVIFL